VPNGAVYGHSESRANFMLVRGQGNRAARLGRGDARRRPDGRGAWCPWRFAQFQPGYAKKGQLSAKAMPCNKALRPERLKLIWQEIKPATERLEHFFASSVNNYLEITAENAFMTLVSSKVIGSVTVGAWYSTSK
jgi:hypothetical protein